MTNQITNSDEKQPDPVDLDHTLYVIFHGAIAFYDDPGVPWINVFLADLKDEHVYLCGKFLGEVRIPSGSMMALSGTIPGLDSFNNYVADYVHYTGSHGIGGARVHLDDVYSQFTFPRPDHILHTVNFGRAGDPRKICTVPVFQYRFKNAEDLLLRMFLNYGESVADPDNSVEDTFSSWKPTKYDPTPPTLHVRAEEDRDESEGERDHAVALQILDDSTNQDISQFVAYFEGDPLPGLEQRRFWEVDLSLRKRIAWLADVGNAIERHPPAPGAPFVIQAPPPTRDDDASCAGASGGARV